MRLISGSWTEVSSDILYHVSKCDHAKLGRVRIYPSAMVIQLVCTFRYYQSCLEPILSDLQGHKYLHEEWGRKSEGREYLYTLIFTQEPEKARLMTPEELEDSK